MLNINELLSAPMKGVLTAVCLMLFTACDGTVIAGSIILYALFIVIVPSIITTVIMMNKGYNGCLWFIISLFLSWIGVIIAACMTNIKRIEEQHTEMIAAIASNKGTQTVVVNDAVKEQPTPKTPLSVQPSPNYRIQAIKNLKAKGQPFDEYDVELEIEELQIAQKNQAYMPATASIQDAPPSVQTPTTQTVEDVTPEEPIEVEVAEEQQPEPSMQEAPPVSETQENDVHETAEEDSYDDNTKSSTKTALWISGALATVLMAAVGVYFYLNHNGQSYKEPALTKHVVPLRVENGLRYVQMTINGVKVDCKLDNSDRITIPVHKAAVLVKDGVIALGDFSGLGAAALSLGSFITNFDVSSLSRFVNKDVTIDLKTVQVSDKNLFLPNTKASVNLNPMSDYTVGQGIFAVFAKYNIDYQKNELVIYTKEANASPSRPSTVTVTPSPKYDKQSDNTDTKQPIITVKDEDYIYYWGLMPNFGWWTINEQKAFYRDRNCKQRNGYVNKNEKIIVLDVENEFYEMITIKVTKICRQPSNSDFIIKIGDIIRYIGDIGWFEESDRIRIMHNNRLRECELDLDMHLDKKIVTCGDSYNSYSIGGDIINTSEEVKSFVRIYKSDGTDGYVTFNGRWAWGDGALFVPDRILLDEEGVKMLQLYPEYKKTYSIRYLQSDIDDFESIKETAIREANRGRVSDGTIYRIVAQEIFDNTVINNAKVSKVRFNGARQIYAVTINNEWIAKITIENGSVVVERIQEGNGMYVDCNIRLSNKL